jgi:hypothetical protein
MPRSPEEIARFKDHRFLLRRRHEERAQADTYKWWLANNRALGVMDFRLLYASGAWLGKPNTRAFFILLRLHALGYCADAPRLMLAISRGPFCGLMLYFRHPDSRETHEESTMKGALANQGYEVVTISDARQATEVITDYLSAFCT